MKTKIQLTRLTLALALALASLATTVLAAKPPKPGGGGGDSGPVPPGTVYFQQWPASSEGRPRSMNADGSSKADSIVGEPTAQRHDGKRWFLTSRVTATDPEGNELYDLFAVAEDGVELPLGVESVVGVWGRWAKDDSVLSYEAYGYTADGWTGGLYVAQVEWTDGFPRIGTPEKVLNTISANGESGIYFFDWSPSGDEAVYVREDYVQGNWTYGLEVVRSLADGTTETRSLVSQTWAYAPQWSPDGSRIAYEGSGGIWTIRPDGTGAAQVSSAAWPNVHLEPGWSPDSQHLVFTERTRHQVKKRGVITSTYYTYDIWRIAASGSGPLNLTGDTDESCFAIAWR